MVQWARELGEGMKADTERLLIAESAAEWLVRLDTATPKQREEFQQWLKLSPVHVEEFLAATATQVQLKQLFKNRRLDAPRFAQSAGNVREMSDYMPGRKKRDS